MRRRWLVCAALLAAASAQAADRAVHLRVPPDLAHEVSAMPLIAEPADEAERRINAALQRLDAKVLTSIADCRARGGENFDWARAVDSPMRGPGFFDVVITDGGYCGGAHPWMAVMAVVYDLRTGAPVDWMQLLPAALVGRQELVGDPATIRTVTLASPRLFDLFRAGYAANDAEPACKEAVRDAGEDGLPGFQAWLDAKQGGLVLQISLPHVLAPCEDRVVLSAATLKQEGATPALLDALAAAR